MICFRSKDKYAGRQKWNEYINAGVEYINVALVL